MTFGGPDRRNGLRALLTAVAVSVLSASARADAPAASAAPPASEPAPTPAPAPKLATEGPVARAEPGAPKASATEPDHEVRLIMADGQLRTHTIEVFATENIPRSKHPRLQLLSSHAVTSKDAREDTWFRPLAIAPNQTRTVTIAGVEQAALGTLLLFDLHTYPVHAAKPMTRVRPVLAWDDDDAPACQPDKKDNTCRVLIGEQEVNFGNPVAAYLWSALVLGVVLVALLVARVRGLIGIFRGTDGRLSLARCQVAAWTLAVGWVVLSFGFMLRASPDLPWQVAILMGLSLTTATVSYRKEVATQVPNSLDHSFSDLITGTDGQVSLARVQMLVWTVISLVLFVSKSILQGVVWAVPTELVALMGLSQAGYLLPKWIKPEDEAPATKGAAKHDVAKPADAPKPLESLKPPPPPPADAPKPLTPPEVTKSRAPFESKADGLKPLPAMSDTKPRPPFESKMDGVKPVPPPPADAKVESPKPPPVIEEKADAPKLPAPPIEAAKAASKPPPKRSVPAKPPTGGTSTPVA